MLYATPYDLTTKKCLARSMPSGFNKLAEAVAIHASAGTKVLSHSKRLLLLNCGDDAGLAFSDYIVRCEK